MKRAVCHKVYCVYVSQLEVGRLILCEMYLLHSLTKSLFIFTLPKTLTCVNCLLVFLT